MAGGDDVLDMKESDDDGHHDGKCSSLSEVQVTDAPILVLFCFHEAFRSELAELRCLAETACTTNNAFPAQEWIVKLRQRFEFLRLVYKYHCAAEDEVIFLALDAHVENVVCTYSLEHKCIDDVFDSIFQCLSELAEKNENLSVLLQEFVYRIGTAEASFYLHMIKEEEQIFPLLMQQFSVKEQASLIWNFICSIPVMLLEDIFPWIMSCLNGGKQAEFKNCLKEIVPGENLLQEVFDSWIGKSKQHCTFTCSNIERGQSIDGFTGTKVQLNSLILEGRSTSFHEKYDGVEQVNVLYLWHVAIRNYLQEILGELYEMRNSSSFQMLDSILLELKFITNVTMCYSNAQEKFLHPLLNSLDTDRVSLSKQHLLTENHLEGLVRLIFGYLQNGMSFSKFVEELCGELKLFIVEVSTQFTFQETEVFPAITKSYGQQIQARLLYMSLKMMPLGLLKSVVSWFAACLSENESRSILYDLKWGDCLVHKSFASLLNEWFQIGTSGKTSIDKFQRELQQTFKSRYSFLSEPINKNGRFAFSNADIQHCKASATSYIGDKKSLSSSLAGPHNVKKSGVPYSSGINLHVLFPQTTKMLHPYPRFPLKNASGSSVVSEMKPIDIIVFFHKAIKKDLDYLVVGSAQLDQNDELLTEFCKRFNVIRTLNQIHTNSEDDIAFPALETKVKLKNMSQSYTIDHKLEVQHFRKISLILEEMFELQNKKCSADSSTLDQRILKHHQLSRKLHELCTSLHKVLFDHLNHEDIEIWPSFRESFSNEEQEKVVGNMLGRIGADILQNMIPWLMESLTQEEQHALMFLWSIATKNTMFDEWLGEWWDGYSIAKLEKETSNSSCNVDPLEIATKYLSKEIRDEPCGAATTEKSGGFCHNDHADVDVEFSMNCDDVSNANMLKGEKEKENCEYSECNKILSDTSKSTCSNVENYTSQLDKGCLPFKVGPDAERYKHLLTISQEDLETAIRKVSRDTSLDSEKKSLIIQNLLMSRWIVRQRISHLVVGTETRQDFPGQDPSYRDPLEEVFGCKHYKRNCKLFFPCCDQLFTCIRCHDEFADHSVDRKSITSMMCMKCLIIQPISSRCSTVACNNLSMAKYYCRICRLFDDERKIYHCPYCNLCRVGKGLGLDYFHCMKCNACMSLSLAVHSCREKCLEDNCPICHEYIFTSSAPVKALQCGHLMHSSCFLEYTITHYTCPICSKSLGDMQVYYRMLDVLLAEEKNSDELPQKTQIILCNDCEKKGESPFHFLYHKCSSCGSYNTRVLS